MAGAAGERTPLVDITWPHQRRQRWKRGVIGVVVLVALSLALYGVSNLPPWRPTAFDLHGHHDPITDDNWFCGETKFEADYIRLSDKQGDDEYFYWLVRSRDQPESDPLVLWLTGGPGGSSIMAMLTENGPCLVRRDVSTKWNAYSWTNRANVIWLDQPSGVGFSAYNNAVDTDHTETDVGKNIYAFIMGFLDKHPEFVGRPFFITGESYGGHYVPGSAHYIWQQVKALPASERRINLQAIAIGNGLTNPLVQYKYNQDMADNQYGIFLLTDEQRAQMKKDSELCIQLTAACQVAPMNGSICEDAQGCWGQKLIGPFAGAHRNLYDIRKHCSPRRPEDCGLDYSFLDEYLSLPVVQRHLNGTKHSWIESNQAVNRAFVASGDWSFSYHTHVADLLNDGVRVLIYAGDADLMCNWIGNRAWTLELEWQGKEAFNAAAEQPFVVHDPRQDSDDAINAGVVRQAKNLAFIRLYEAGHMVPQDQPTVSWVMIDRFFRGVKY
ncbi:hypothetical protein P43SY_008721 [Pythium insidiosum]|uniref:Carboxypeptidase n=1 Tax=Pythium insidiosum TaxID=114742 RepID=A0AAD5M2H7_PYTIN|nr:hypothetical protein P43SY_008721 [Pythium insidiosum]